MINQNIVELFSIFLLEVLMSRLPNATNLNCSILTENLQYNHITSFRILCVTQSCKDIRYTFTNHIFYYIIYMHFINILYIRLPGP